MERMQRSMACLLALGALVISASTASAEAGHHPFVFSFFDPVSTNLGRPVSTNFRLSVLYSRVGAVRGVDLSGLVARTDGGWGGFGASGLVSVVGGSLEGMSLVGGFGYVGGSARGLQAAGLVSFVRGGFGGAQYAGAFSNVDGDLRGLQVSGLYNLTLGDARWLQLAAVANQTGGSFAGLQLGASNFVSKTAAGAQVGFMNFSARSEGLQLGFGNMTGTATGVQIGVVNLAERMEGVPFGMVNIAAENGEAGVVAFASSYAAVNVGIRTAVRGFSSMLTVGVGDIPEEYSSTLFLSWHYGYRVDLQPRWGLVADFGFVHAIPQPSDDPFVNDRLHFALQPRLLLDWRATESTRLFAGGGASVIFDKYASDATSETQALAVAGILFD